MPYGLFVLNLKRFFFVQKNNRQPSEANVTYVLKLQNEIYGKMNTQSVCDKL